MTQLSVNINKVATLRNARGGNVPDVLQFALDCERFGAQGITVHPRPDERHIRYSDVYQLRGKIATELNIEGYPSDRFVQMVCEVCPTQVTLVPDAPGDLTSHEGWDVAKYKDFLQSLVVRFHEHNVRVSIFVQPDGEAIRQAAEIGADRVELYTEPYARLFPQDAQAAVEPYVNAAKVAIQCGLQVNAGHDLSLDNLRYFHQCIPQLAEVSIGHALIADALYLGIEQTIHQYKQCLLD